MSLQYKHSLGQHRNILVTPIMGTSSSTRAPVEGVDSKYLLFRRCGSKIPLDPVSINFTPLLFQEPEGKVQPNCVSTSFTVFDNKATVEEMGKR